MIKPEVNNSISVGMKSCLEYLEVQRRNAAIKCQLCRAVGYLELCTALALHLGCCVVDNKGSGLLLAHQLLGAEGLPLKSNDLFCQG
ncbi:hypothetical protein CEXT_715111 [Caerostris extrusa]|uniref:Uncharacterized protein n=1 Tax=Caerostris extrusa TaxID=172846 RepID=A0AAV4PSY1_CAEEX|nr:hypothetical protein CEXT_715111 [Caerostris extrusa]